MEPEDDLTRPSGPGPSQGPANPYIGPRSFRTGETLFGRDREAQEIVDLLIAERIVLLYSPSGAGKTSLVQAKLIPMLEREGFAVRPIVRVGQASGADDIKAGSTNRHILSTLRSLEGGPTRSASIPPGEIGGKTLLEFLEANPPAMRGPDPDSFVGPPAPGRDGYDAELIVFDQFEEILTIAPNAIGEKEEFFDQVGEALRDKTRWALFSMREEFVPRLDPYLRRIPRRLATRFRLDLLGVDAARKAIIGPALDDGVTISPEVVTGLVDNLRKVRVQEIGGEIGEQLGPYVEPVQLQVVCWRSWDDLSRTGRIDDSQSRLASGDVDTALGGYYTDRVKVIAEAEGVPERQVREWCESQLITDQGLRGQVLREHPTSQGLSNAAIERLIDSHLVRAEERRGATWFELAHDRLIEPVRSSNRAWEATHLHSSQRRASEWLKLNRPPNLLLSGDELKAAETWERAQPGGVILPGERVFLDASRDARAARAEMHKARRNKILLHWGPPALALLLVGLAVAVGVMTWAIRSNEKAQKALIQVAASEYQARLAAVREKDSARNARLEEAKAKEQKTLAEVERGRADQARRSAEILQRILERRQVAATALSKLSERIDLAARYSLEANRGEMVSAGDATLAPLEAGAIAEARGSLLEVLNKAPRLAATLGAFRNFTSGAAFSRDGRTLALVGDYETILLYQVSTSEGPERQVVLSRRAVVKGPVVTCVALSPDGHLLAAGSSNLSVCLWKVDQLVPHDEPGAFQQPHVVLPWSVEPEKGTVRAAGIVPFDGDREIKVVAFSPDGAELAAAGEAGAIVVHDLTRRPERLDDGWPPRPPRLTLSGHSGWVGALAYRPDGKVLASGGTDATLRLWATADGKLLSKKATAANTGISAVAFHPDGRTLASAGGDRAVTFWPVESDGLRSPATVQGPLTEAVTRLAYNRDGSRLASAGWDRQVTLWDAANRRVVEQYPALQRDVITGLAYGGPDGQVLASGSWDRSVYLWDSTRGEGEAVSPPPAAGTPKAGTPKIRAVAFDRAGKVMAMAADDGSVLLWDAEGHRPIRTLSSGEGPVDGVDFDPSGSRLAVPDGSGGVALWDVALGDRPPIRIQPDRTSARRPEGARIVAAFSPDRASPAVATIGIDGVIRLYALGGDGSTPPSGVAKGKPSLSFDHVILPDNSPRAAADSTTEKPVAYRAVAFDRRGARLAAGTNDGRIALIDLKAGARPDLLLETDPIARPSLAHQGWVWGLEFHPTKNQLASAGTDGVIIWDLDRSPPRPFDLNHMPNQRHPGTVKGLAYSDDGQWLGTIGAWKGPDDVLQLWSADLMTPVGPPLKVRAGELWGLDFSDSLKKVAAAGDRGLVRLLTVDPEAWNRSVKDITEFDDGSGVETTPRPGAKGARP